MDSPERVAARRPGRALRAVLQLTVVTALLAIASATHADELTVVPARDGALGAWLVAGPLYADPLSAEQGHDLPEPRAGAVVRDKIAFRLATTPNGRFDVRSLLRAGDHAFALFGARLRVARASRLLLVLGVDDGVSVLLDGREIYRRNEVRPAFHDDDAVAFDAPEGDHSLLVRARQFKGPWQFRARLLDAADLLPPAHVAFVLPGTEADNPAAIASDMASAQLSLEPSGDRYRPDLLVHWLGGAPSGVDTPVRVRASVSHGSSSRPLYDVSLGAVRATDRGVFDLSAALPDVLASDVRDDEPGGKLVFEVSAGGRVFTFDRPMIPAVRKAVARIDAALRNRIRALASSLDVADVVESTLRLERDRLVGFVSSGDTDTEATDSECRAVDSFVSTLEDGKDPIRTIPGPARLAYRSPLDGKLHPFGLYVPPGFSPASDKKYPLVVSLHGLNGLPMQMLRIFFGQDDPTHRAPWEDRHIHDFAPLQAFVVAPSGFGNLSYREAGEADVMTLRNWVTTHFPIDQDRVYVTGLSMGGTGTALVAFHYPDSFAAAAPLCGYHSFAIRSDVAGRVLRPWEKSLVEYWSTVSWADNGQHLPLYVVQGTKDLPAKNSGVLIDRYKNLGYSITDEHPDVGHDVWQMTYEGFKAFHWLDRHRRVDAPRSVEFKTSSMRYLDHDWVHVLALHQQLGWAKVSARAASRTKLEVTTTGVDALRLDPPPSVLDRSKSVSVVADGQHLSFEPGQPLVMFLDGTWKQGTPPPPAALAKTPGRSGPITDAFHEPMVFVYGTRDPSATRLNHEVATTLAHPGFGVEARWPVLADIDVDEAMASSHALFLVGNARSNAYLARIEARLPIRIEGDAVVAGASRFRGEQVGTMFIYPNPEHPERYVLVLEGADITGLLRGLSLPRLLPDFIVYDAGLAGARGQTVLGTAHVLAGGMFDSAWNLPGDVADGSTATR